MSKRMLSPIVKNLDPWIFDSIFVCLYTEVTTDEIPSARKVIFKLNANGVGAVRKPWIKKIYYQICFCHFKKGTKRALA